MEKANGKPITSWSQALPKAGVIVILGHRGTGKSALAWRLLEQLHKGRKLKAAVVGLPKSRRRLVPNWVEHHEGIARLPEKAIILLDEAALRFSARRSQADINLAMAGLVALSRQRGQVILFVTHTARMLDVELIFESDLVIYKLPSAAHVKFERRETAEFTGRARERLLAQKRPTCWSYVLNFHQGREGLLRNPLPSFWSELLSNAWAGLDVNALAQSGAGKPPVGHTRRRDA